MKKIITGLLTYFLLVSNISALSTTYYSEYSDFSTWQEEPIIENDTTKIEIERRYRWYKETTKNGEYYIEEENNLEYPLINRKDMKNNEKENIINNYYFFCYLFIRFDNHIGYTALCFSVNTQERYINVAFAEN